MTELETKVINGHRPDVAELKKRLENSLPGIMHNIHKKDMSPAIRAKMHLFEEPPDGQADCVSGRIPAPPSLPMGPLLDQQGLILPRKPGNPYLESRDRQDLNRELLFNQKIGKNVLNQKSELQRALEKHKDHQVKKELENEKSQNKTLLERAIEERARRLDQQIERKEEPSGRVPEFLQVHAKLRGVKEGK